MRRSRQLLLPFLGALVPAALSGCGESDGRESPPAADAVGGLTLTDAEQRRVPLPGPADRVVSLVPSATLTLSALGAEDVLVARTDHDTATWTRELPSVGGGLEPSLEAIVAARPDLVIRFGGPQDTRTPVGLDRLGIPHVAVRPDRIEDVIESIRLLGRAVGRDAAAETLVREIRAVMDSIRGAGAGRPRVRVAYVLGGDPPWVAGPGTYIHELIELAGGRNAFEDLGSLYAAVSVEELIARPVDVIVTPDAGRLDPHAVGGARVAEVGADFELPGPGVADAARLLARIVHPPEDA